MTEWVGRTLQSCSRVFLVDRVGIVVQSSFLGVKMAVAPSDFDVRIAPSSLTAYLDDDNEQFALKMELFINCSPRLSFNYQGYYT